jgi:nuclear pore complex protein Nup85
MQELYSKGPSHWVFYHRFMFVSRYAQFHESLANSDYAAAAKAVVSIINEELAPRAWGAVLLADCIPLIRFGMFFAPYSTV